MKDGTIGRIEDDVRALVASIEDASEAEALDALFTLAGQLSPEPETEQEYKPFVYPH